MIIFLAILPAALSLAYVSPKNAEPIYRPASHDRSQEYAWKEPGKYIKGTSCNSVGDVAAITYCYCGAPNPSAMSSAWPEAHYIEVNYYNVHTDQTFIINETCKSTNRMDCLGHHWSMHRGKSGGKPRWRELPQKEWSQGYRESAWNGNCGLYPKAKPGETCRWENAGLMSNPADKREAAGCAWDEFCFWPNAGHHSEYHKHHEDDRANRVAFNGQQRWLNDQGFVNFDNQDIRDVCTQQCLERTGLPIMAWKADEVVSHQSCAQKLDDMCEGCK